MQKIVEFEAVIASIPSVCQAFGISVTRLAEAIGVTRTTFYRKQKEKRFTALEVRKIVAEINR